MTEVLFKIQPPLSTSTNPFGLYEQNDCFPVYFIADDVFSLRQHCMKSDPQTNLGDRKCKAFVFGGIDFECFQMQSRFSLEKAITITLALLKMH